MAKKPRRTQCNRTYTDENVDEIRAMLLKSMTKRQIAEAMGMNHRLVDKIVCEYHLALKERKPYRLPHFAGWDFRPDNLNLGAHL